MRIACLGPCNRTGDHLVGHVYAKFFNEEDTKKAVGALHGRFYAGASVASKGALLDVCVSPRGDRTGQDSSRTETAVETTNRHL